MSSLNLSRAGHCHRQDTGFKVRLPKATQLPEKADLPFLHAPLCHGSGPTGGSESHQPLAAGANPRRRGCGDQEGGQATPFSNSTALDETDLKLRAYQAAV